jgi:hypothetical protein
MEGVLSNFISKKNESAVLNIHSLPSEILFAFHVHLT